MKLKRLEINGPETYDQWTGLRGRLTVEDAGGSQSITLSAGAIARIVNVIKEEVSDRAVDNANRVLRALTDSVDEALLESAAGNLQLD